MSFELALKRIQAVCFTNCCQYNWAGHRRLCRLSPNIVLVHGTEYFGRKRCHVTDKRQTFLLKTTTSSRLCLRQDRRSNGIRAAFIQQLFI